MTLLLAWLSGAVSTFTLMFFLTGWPGYGLIGLSVALLCFMVAHRRYRDDLGIHAYEDGEDGR